MFSLSLLVVWITLVTSASDSEHYGMPRPFEQCQHANRHSRCSMERFGSQKGTTTRLGEWTPRPRRLRSLLSTSPAAHLMASLLDRTVISGLLNRAATRLAASRLVNHHRIQHGVDGWKHSLQDRVGARRNLWFTEYNGNQIGQISTTGVITEFPIPSANSQPFDIVVGPDGNLWFTGKQCQQHREHYDGWRGHRVSNQDCQEPPVWYRYGLGCGVVVHRERSEQDWTHHHRWIVTEFAIKTATSVPQEITPAWMVRSTLPGASPITVGRVTTAGIITRVCRRNRQQ